MKNPKFMSNPCETLGKLLPHEVINFPKFQEDWTKKVDFYINGQFFNVCGFFLPRL